MSLRIPQIGNAPLEGHRLRRILDAVSGAESNDWAETAAVLLGTPTAFVALSPDAPDTLGRFARENLSPDTLVVTDATLDERFAGHPAVTSEVNLRFYVGAPIVVAGVLLGALCGVDTVPRRPGQKQINALEALARQIASVIDARYEADRLSQDQQRLSDALETAERGEEMARSAAHRFEQLFSAISVACFTYDSTGHIREWNPAAENLWGLSVQDSVCRLAVGPETQELIESQKDRVFGGTTVNGRDRRERTRDGNYRWIVSSTAPLRDLSGRIYGAMCANIDRTDRREQVKQIDAHLRQIEEYSGVLAPGDPLGEDQDSSG